MITSSRASLNLNLPVIGVVAVALFLALLAGLMSAFFPWYLTLMLLTPPVLVWLGWRWPLFAMAGTMGVVYGIIPLGLGKQTDVVAGLFVAFIAFTRRSEIARAWREHRPVWIALAVFLSYVPLNIVYAKYYQGNANVYIFMESASMLYWAVMVPAALICKDADSTRSVLRLLVAGGVVLCLVAVAQSLFSVSLNFSGRLGVSQITENTGTGQDLMRSIFPGMPLVMFSFFMALTATLRRKGIQWGWALVLLITGLGIFVSYGRALWAATVVGALIVAALSGWRALVRLICHVGLGVGLALPMLMAFKPQAVTVAVARMFSVFREGAANSSLGWRITENSYAIPQIFNHPWLGMGLGAEYKPVLTDIRLFSEQTHYIHNGYLYLLLKLGMVGFVALALMIAVILHRAARERGFRRVAESPKVALGVMMAMVLLLNVTQPELFTSASVFSLALLVPVALKAHMDWAE